VCRIQFIVLAKNEGPELQLKLSYLTDSKPCQIPSPSCVQSPAVARQLQYANENQGAIEDE